MIVRGETFECFTCEREFPIVEIKTIWDERGGDAYCGDYCPACYEKLDGKL